MIMRIAVMFLVSLWVAACGKKPNLLLPADVPQYMDPAIYPYPQIQQPPPPASPSP